MKKIILLSAIALFGAAGALSAPEIYMKTLPSASVAAVSNIVYREHIRANGKVAVKNASAVVNAAVSEDDISLVCEGQPVLIYGRGFGKYSGTVSSVADSARTLNSGGGSETVVDVQISFDAYDSSIKDGFSAQTEIYIDDEKEVLVVPYDAVNQDENGAEYVCVFRDGIAVRRDIETGIELSEGIEVISGISEYDKILTSDKQIADGQYVKVVE